MKKLIILLTAFCIFIPVYGAIPAHKIKNPPQGTFKKKRNGTIVQYDSKGKKIGTYKLESGSYKKVK